MSKDIINHPAFPVSAYAGDDHNPPVRPNSGMSIRDYFAAAFAAEMCLHKTATPEEVAGDAYAYADAMLKERTY